MIEKPKTIQRLNSQKITELLLTNNKIILQINITSFCSILIVFNINYNFLPKLIPLNLNKSSQVNGRNVVIFILKQINNLIINILIDLQLTRKGIYTKERGQFHELNLNLN